MNWIRLCIYIVLDIFASKAMICFCLDVTSQENIFSYIHRQTELNILVG